MIYKGITGKDVFDETIRLFKIGDEASMKKRWEKFNEYERDKFHIKKVTVVVLKDEPDLHDARELRDLADQIQRKWNEQGADRK